MFDDVPEDDAGGLDKAAIQAELLKDLQEFMRQKLAMDTRSRLGKPMPAAEGMEGAPPEEEAPAEDPDIPGVEAAPTDEAAAPGGMDISKLKAALAGMKGR